ncbi:MAG: TonB-dependent receptor [Bacteroidota bacterium]|jgi:iron complex outermembrane receptor protein|nr:TonB-dependent receptor [Bacteroidota bacterium]
MTPHLRPTIFLLLFLTAVPTFAQERDSTLHFTLRDSVLVVASRYRSTLARETNALTVISADAIARTADHSLLEAVAWEVPSAFLVDTRMGGFGVGAAATGMLSLRGMGRQPNTGIAVMIDGHPDFMGMFGHPLPDVYGMDDVERVDVLLGPASTVFGGGAMGGVVNIVTRPADRNRMQFSAEAGSWDSYAATMGVSRRFGSHGVQLTVGHRRSGGHVPQSDFTGSRVQAGWDWRISDVWQLSMRGRYVPYTFDDPTRMDDPAGLGTYGDIRRGMGQIVLDNDFGMLRGSTQLHVNAGHHEFSDGFISDDRALGISTYQQWHLSARGSLAIGGDVLQYGGQANVDDTQHLLSTAGAYALALYSPLDMLHLRAGLRWQYHSLALHNLAPSLGISFLPVNGLRLYANIQSGYRYPTLQELYLFPISNPALTEEQSTGYEVGLEYAHARGTLRLAAFRADVRDMITLVVNPFAPPPFRMRNARDAEQWGLEASLRYRILPWLHVQTTWNRLDPDGLTAFNPAQQLKYQVFVIAGRLQAMLAGQYVHALHAGDAETLRMPDYHVLEASVEWKFPVIDAFIRVRNLLDRSYAILPGYPAPGAHAVVGLRYALEQ